MNLPNILTISRVPLMFIVVGLMYADFPYAATAAFWLFIVAALTDWLDGKIARERGIVSSFGRFMDTVIDKVMVIGLMVALVNDEANFMGHDITAMVLLKSGTLEQLRHHMTETLAGWEMPRPWEAPAEDSLWSLSRAELKKRHS